MSTSPLFSGLTAEERDAVERRGATRRFAAGESLFAQGDVAATSFVIPKGRVKLWRSSEEGTALTLALLEAGAPIGTLGAATDVHNHATATALTAVETLVWPIDALRELMDGTPTLAANVLRTVSGYAEQLIERLEEVASVPVEQRLARTLLRMAQRVYGGEASDGCDLPLSRQVLPTLRRLPCRWSVVS